MYFRHFIYSIFFGFLVTACTEKEQKTVALFSDEGNPMSHFGVENISKSLVNKGYHVEQHPLSELSDSYTSDRIVVFKSANVALSENIKSAGGNPAVVLHKEGFSLQKTGSKSVTAWVMGFDDGGSQYGALELAEQIDLYGLDNIKNTTQNPSNEKRGIKFNIPLDARTPSYTDMSDAGQKNMAEVWDFEFWKDFLDHMAKFRYNFVSLWSLHPFPSMVSVPEYPDIALNDVKRSTTTFAEDYPTSGIGMDAPEILDHLETIKVMSMDEKIAFWQKVMQYAKDRNIDFYMITWNIFTNGTYGKYGITDDPKNEVTIDYFRKSVKAMFDTYPLLAGIGLTTGENFGRSDFVEKEDWAYKTYGLGVLDAATEFPDRTITLVHRQHQTGTQDIARRFQSLLDKKNIEFLFSFKYAQAHIYSSTTQPYHKDFVKDIKDMKTIFTLRNDDVYYFRWGAPDFVREFIKNLPMEISRGFYLGSDQYIWGREFLSTEPSAPREIELEKHWYHWMLWGRLGYDPDLSDDRIKEILQAHFPDTNSGALFDAWQEASMIYPITTGFHWADYDFQWYIEGARSRPAQAQNSTGFHDVNRFISLGTHETSGDISIPDYVKSVKNGTALVGKTPLQVSEQLHARSDKALELIDGISENGNRELRMTLSDIRSMAYLGKYYAYKIRGSTELALFREMKKSENQKEAIAQLKKAAEYWRLYVSNALTQYTNPLWTNRVGYVDWRKTMTEVLNDIVIAGGEPVIESTPASSEGKSLEAEDATINGGQVKNEVIGFTGKGYVGFDLDGSVDWTFNAPIEGTYILEVRYAMDTGVVPSSLKVNEQSNPFVFWTTGGKSTWGFDRLPVQLKNGMNEINLDVKAGIIIDRLNIITAE